jgi:hypothetical protein
MSDLASVAPAFVEMAHRIVWATVATVDLDGRPRGRILLPLPRSARHSRTMRRTSRSLMAVGANRASTALNR